MCGGSRGPSGPSQAEIVAQENAARDRAQAEADKIRAEQEAQKAAENTKIVAERTKTAENDLARRTRNRTLLGGIGLEEDENDLEAGTSKSAKKAKRATLIGSMGGGI